MKLNGPRRQSLEKQIAPAAGEAQRDASVVLDFNVGLDADSGICSTRKEVSTGCIFPCSKCKERGQIARSLPLVP